MERTEQRPSREEIAKREIGRTDISPALSWTLVAVFLLTIATIPALQSLHEIRGAASSTSRRPGFCEITEVLDGVPDAYRTGGKRMWARVLAANARLMKNLHDYEGRLEDASLLAKNLLGPTQYALTRFGGAGNEKAYVGLDGWLFYRPGVDHLTGRGFLDPASLARRAAAGSEYASPPRPDPRPAIREFQEQLAGAGVLLVLMPIPTKPSIEPERLSARYRDRLEIVDNPSFERFKAEMVSAGVLVFDPAPILLERKRKTGLPQYLETDTHWTPDAMQYVAERLANFIGRNVPLPVRVGAGYLASPARAGHLGDIAVMMRLPADQDLFPPQSVTIRQVLQPDGQPWRPAPDADVLLLGDSFTNIYSLPEMGWGEAAGLAEQLSLALQRPVDRIAQNDSGAHATRETLALELTRGRPRLAGKRVLIWEFAARELSVGDWRRVPMARRRPRPAAPESRPEPSGRPAAAMGGALIVRGRIKAGSDVPEPGSVPYRDAIRAIHLVEVVATSQGGTTPPREVVVYLWGLRDNRSTEGARSRPGQVITLTLTPWSEAQARYGRFTRVELDDPDFSLIDLPTYWAEVAP